MRSPRLIFAVLALIVVAILAAGCGGNNSSNSSNNASSCMSGMVMPGCKNSSSQATNNYWKGVNGDKIPSGGKTRVYYIAAVNVAWDYAPSGYNKINGKLIANDPTASTYLGYQTNRVGRVYWKTLYRQFSDGTFKHQIVRGPRNKHLGILGPIIRAEVGDTIIVHYKNKSFFPSSIHPHGVFYTKSSEGAGYADGTKGKDKVDDSVAPGKEVTYTWKVPERAGPGPMDGSSIVWMYHSHVNEVEDVNAGLIGPIIITRKGMARPDGSPKDVSREFVTYFSIINENITPGLGDSIKNFTVQDNRFDLSKLPAAPGPNTQLVEPDGDVIAGGAHISNLTARLLLSKGFGESNLKHTINGYMYGNTPGLVMHKGEHVRWYVMDLGDEVDIHTPHWHGNTVEVSGMRTDMVELLPGSMMVADMSPDAVGTWVLHCHVGDHLKAGMQALYTVKP